jgi:hypothetical protein
MPGRGRLDAWSRFPDAREVRPADDAAARRSGRRIRLPVSAAGRPRRCTRRAGRRGPNGTARPPFDRVAAPLRRPEPAAAVGRAHRAASANLISSDRGDGGRPAMSFHASELPHASITEVSGDVVVAPRVRCRRLGDRVRLRASGGSPGRSARGADPIVLPEPRRGSRSARGRIAASARDGERGSRIGPSMQDPSCRASTSVARLPLTTGSARARFVPAALRVLRRVAPDHL